MQPPSSFHFLPVNANRAPLIASPMQSLSFQTDVFGGRGAMIYYRGHSDSFAQAPAVNCDGGSTYPGQHVLVDRRRFYGIYSLELAMRASACSRGCARITSFSDISKETHPARFPSWGAFKSLYRLPRCLFIKPPHRRQPRYSLGEYIWWARIARRLSARRFPWRIIEDRFKEARLRRGG